MDSIVKDISLAPSGKQKIEWVKKNMPVLRALEKEFAASQPFKGLRISVSVHMEAKTAYFVKVLAAGGAQVSATGCNPLSTQDDVAAALAADGLSVFAIHDPAPGEYEKHIKAALSHGPNIIVDDGGDFVNMLHTTRADLLPGLIGGCEETTTGIIRLTARARDGALKFPMIAVNNADSKHFFDNRYGTGQSVWDGINRTTNLIVAGKTVVVTGYGWCGKGISMRAKGLGAKVIITEVNPVRALEAYMDGFEVMKMDEAAKKGDIFVTVSGCEKIICKRHFEVMKDGALLCNAGHFDCEICLPELDALAVEKAEQRKNIMGYRLADGRWLNVLGEGRLVNLACGDGHPAEIMDMSFSVQALCVKYIAENRELLKPGVYDVPKEIDQGVAAMKLASWGVEIDSLSGEQKEYLESW